MTKDKYHISLVIPTRSRHQLMRELLSSIYTLAYNPDFIETILMYDSDDLETKELLINEKAKYVGCTIELIECEMTPEKRQRGVSIQQEYYGPGAMVSKAFIVWGLNNDCEIVTKHWDKILKEATDNYLKDKPDGVAYISIDDDTPGNETNLRSCFPAFTRPHINVFQGIWAREIHSWGADNAAYDIYLELEQPRFLNLKNQLKVLHKSYHKVNNGEGDDVSHLLCARITELSRTQKFTYIYKLNSLINNV